VKRDSSVHITRASSLLRWLTSATHSARTGLGKETHHARDDSVSVSQPIYSGKTESYSSAAATRMIHGSYGSGNWSFLARQPPPTPPFGVPSIYKNGAPRLERPRRVFERPESGLCRYNQALPTDTLPAPGLCQSFPGSFLHGKDKVRGK